MIKYVHEKIEVNNKYQSLLGTEELYNRACSLVWSVASSGNT